MSNNEDGLICNESHLQIGGGCDSDEESGDEHNHHHHHLHDEEDDILGGSGSDLKLSGQEKKAPAGNLNIRAAMIHVIGDFVQSIGVLISAVVIKFYPNAKLIDPACTFVFSVIVFFTTIRIMKESLTVLLDATPLTINMKKLEKELRCIDGVRSVHHLNVFGVSVDWNVMTVHLVIGESSEMHPGSIEYFIESFTLPSRQYDEWGGGDTDRGQAGQEELRHQARDGADRATKEETFDCSLHGLESPAERPRAYIVFKGVG